MSARSPDLQRAPVRSAAVTAQFTIVPLGPGEPTTLALPLQAIGQLPWFPDGQRLAIPGSEAGTAFKPVTQADLKVRTTATH